MADTWKTKSSFQFGGTDMYSAYGIKLTEDSIPEDVLLPELRPRKVNIPLRNGVYDYGARYYSKRHNNLYFGALFPQITEWQSNNIFDVYYTMSGRSRSSA